MSQIIPFTDNYRDLSNDRGYQFEFVCERCGNGYRSPFKSDMVKTGKGLLKGLGRLAGGTLAELGNAADEMIDRSTNSSAKDKALEEAVAAVADQFHQCRNCGNWVCDPVCWNKEVGQCLTCSPSVGDTMSAAQAAAQVDQIKTKAQEVDWTKDLDMTTRAKVQCPHCGKSVDGGKFCPECGKPLAATRSCTNCGAEVKDGAKFCAECGQKV
ncbi:MAG: zinc ribbon domain-containing protein [Actinomycetota bacterium]|nr:zinc ribbon domain-containing protein [Actinomycetota bacterium]